MNDTVAKVLSDGWPVGEIMAIRGIAVALAILAIIAWRGQYDALRIRNPGAMALRAGSIAAAAFLYLTAISIMPIADVLAIVFVAPVFATLLAILLLGEKVRWRRWMAMGAGFIGVTIALNPGGVYGGLGSHYDWQVAILPIGVALLVAVRDVASRRVVSGDHSLGIMFYTVLVVTVAGTGTLFTHTWAVPTMEDFAFVLLAAALMFGAYFFQIESFRFAPVNVVAPFRYISLIYAAFVGWLIWGDIPQWNMALGAVVIVASGMYIWWREQRWERSGPVR